MDPEGGKADMGDAVGCFSDTTRRFALTRLLGRAAWMVGGEVSMVKPLPPWPIVRFGEPLTGSPDPEGAAAAAATEVELDTD